MKFNKWTFAGALLFFAITSFSLVLLTSLTHQAHAAGHIGPAEVAPELRSWERRFTLSYPDRAANTTDVTLGLRGVIAVGTMNANTQPTFTSSIAAMPYPGKLNIVLKDGGNDSTLTCSSVQIGGYSQFGTAIGETVNTIAEVANSTTTLVYERVTRIKFSGCIGANNANDRVRVSAAPIIGLPARMISKAGLANAPSVISMCITDTTPQIYCYLGSQLTYDAKTFAITINNLTAATPAAPTQGNGQGVMIMTRWPAGF